MWWRDGFWPRRTFAFYNYTICIVFFVTCRQPWANQTIAQDRKRWLITIFSPQSLCNQDSIVQFKVLCIKWIVTTINAKKFNQHTTAQFIVITGAIIQIRCNSFHWIVKALPLAWICFWSFKYRRENMWKLTYVIQNTCRIIQQSRNPQSNFINTFPQSMLSHWHKWSRKASNHR